ncbi:recombination protein RecR [bacterium]|nr:recombination protein RecR [bacterium]
MIPQQIKDVIEIFSKFPTVGERTATRFALYLLSLPKENVENFCKKILALKKEIKFCKLCFGPFVPRQGEEICPICKNKNRDRSLLCIVERETDLWQIEKTKKYEGLYFILGGKMDFLKENPLGKLRIEELKRRIEEGKPKEVILALNPTPGGLLTMDYLTKILKPYNIKITRLGRGLPIGSELEYADEDTLSSALEGRR